MRSWERVRAVLERRAADYVALLRDLVRADTQVEGHGILGGREANGQRLIAERLRALGCEPDVWVPDAAELDRHPAANPGHRYDAARPNVVGVFRGTGGGRSLILNGHVDTMPVGPAEAWTRDPLGGEVVGGRLYGRGAADMKAGLAGHLCALWALREAGVRLRGDVIFQSVVDEEGGGNGTLACLLRGYRADAAIVGEPTALSVYPAHMGWLFFSVKVTGKPLHSSRKWKGVSAIDKAFLLIQALYDLERQWLMERRHPLLPPPTLNVGEIHGGTAGSTVPETCEFRLCLHYLPTDLDAEGTDRDVEAQVRSALLDRARGDPWLGQHPPVITRYQAGLPLETPADHPLVQTIRAAAAAVLGAPAPLEGMPAGCDARHFQHVAGIPAIVFGPGEPEQAHAIDESVAVDEFLRHVAVTARTVMDWCGVDEAPGEGPAAQ